MKKTLRKLFSIAAGSMWLSGSTMQIVEALPYTFNEAPQHTQSDFAGHGSARTPYVRATEPSALPPALRDIDEASAPENASGGAKDFSSFMTEDDTNHRRSKRNGGMPQNNTSTYYSSTLEQSSRPIEQWSGSRRGGDPPVAQPDKFADNPDVDSDGVRHFANGKHFDLSKTPLAEAIDSTNSSKLGGGNRRNRALTNQSDFSAQVMSNNNFDAVRRLPYRINDDQAVQQYVNQQRLNRRAISGNGRNNSGSYIDYLKVQP